MKHLSTAAFCVVAADALLLKFVPFVPAIYGLRFLVAGAALVILIRLGVPRGQLGLSFDNAKRDLKWTALFAAFVLMIWLALILIAILIIGLLNLNVALSRIPVIWYDVFGYLLAAPVAEEMIYRSCVVPALRVAFPSWLVLVASGVIFYSLHLAYGRPWWSLHYFLAGVVLTWAFLCTGKLWVTIVLHILGNVTVGVGQLLFALKPEWIHGLLHP